MATTHGTYTFDTQNDSDCQAFTFTSYNGGSGQSSAGVISAAGTAAEFCHDTNGGNTTNTGPDQGQGGVGDGYLYTECSSPGANGDEYTMTFNTTLDASAEQWQFNFYTLQRGNNTIGENQTTCEVQINESGGGWTTITDVGGSGEDTTDGTDWTYRSVDLSESGANTDSSTQVRLLITTQTNTQAYYGDYGIDTVTIVGSDLEGISSVDSDYGDASDELDLDEDSLDVNGLNFESSQGSGTVYLADESTLATSDAEVDLDNAVQSWSDTTVNLDLTALSSEHASLESLMASDGPSLYVILVNNSSDEYSLPVTVHRAKAFQLDDSTYITAGGANTTYQLTAPATKSTSDFGGGRIQDDENPADTVDLDTDEYGEWEWAIEAITPSDGTYLGAQMSETYQFRILIEDETLDTYSVTPEWTIAPSGGNYDQDTFRGRNDDGTDETDATWKAIANTNWDQPQDENFRIRFLIEELDDVEDSDVAFQLQYNHNSGGWNDVTASSSVARASASTKLTDGGNTTEQLSGPGTFLTTNAGVDDANGLAGGSALDFTTTANQEVEVEYCLQLRSADTSHGDTIQFRLVKSPSYLLGSYTNTPTVTIPTGAGLLLASAEYQQESAGAENPGTFDFSRSLPWGAITLALRLDTSAAQTSMSTTSKFDTIETTGTVTTQDSATIDGLTIDGDLQLTEVVDIDDLTVTGTLDFDTAGTYNWDTAVLNELTNSSGGSVILNLSGASSYETNTGPNITINLNVNVTITVIDQSGNALPGVEVAMFQDNTARTELISSTSTDESGQVTGYAPVSVGAVIIRARQSTSVATFDTSQSFTSEVLTTDSAHGFEDGDPAVYSKNGGSANVGLTAGTTYYVNSISATTLSLHTTAAYAISDSSRVDLSTDGSETHHLDPERYIAGSASGTIGATDFSTEITLVVDSVATA